MQAVSYEENSEAMVAQARAELLKSAGRDWIKAKEAATQAGELELTSINLLRSCGLKLQEASDHQKPSFTFFEHHQSELPATMTFAAVNFCVSLACNLDKPVTNLDEAHTARRKLFQAFEAASAPRRLEPQSPREHNPWSELVAGAASFTTLFDKLDTRPMEKWNREKLSTFIRATKPIAERYQKALSLLH